MIQWIFFKKLHEKSVTVTIKSIFSYSFKLRTSLFFYTPNRKGILDYPKSITLDTLQNAIMYIWKIGPVDARSATETGLNRHQRVLFLTWVQELFTLPPVQVGQPQTARASCFTLLLPGTSQLSACTRSIYQYYRYSLLSGPSGSL